MYVVVIYVGECDMVIKDSYIIAVTIVLSVVGIIFGGIAYNYDFFGYDSVAAGFIFFPISFICLGCSVILVFKCW